MALVVSKARTVKKSSPLIQIELQKYNPNHDARGRFTTAGGGGALSSFERKVDEAYGTGEEAFTIAHTGDESTAALGTYLAKGHVVNEHLREETGGEFLTDTRTAEDVAVGLDNAIAMAPPMPHQTVWRVARADAVLGMQKGKVYVDKGFASTTAADITHPDNGQLLLTLAHVSSGKKVLTQIDTGSSGKGIYMPKMFPGQPIAEFEKEFLLPRYTKMKYLGPDYKFLDSGQTLEIHKFKVVD